jgi:hypothetical protein
MPNLSKQYLAQNDLDTGVTMDILHPRERRERRLKMMLEEVERGRTMFMELLLLQLGYRHFGRSLLYQLGRR